MEFLTNSLKEVVSKLNENQKEEIDVVESIINTNESNKEYTKEKLFRFIEKQEIKDCINFILGCIEHAVYIRPKERESLLFLVTSVFNYFNFNFKITNNFITLKDMLQVKNFLPSDEYTKKHVFDFAEEGTVGRAIFNNFLRIILMKEKNKSLI